MRDAALVATRHGDMRKGASDATERWRRGGSHVDAAADMREANIAMSPSPRVEFRRLEATEAPKVRLSPLSPPPSPACRKHAHALMTRSMFARPLICPASAVRATRYHHSTSFSPAAFSRRGGRDAEPMQIIDIAS